MEIDNTIPEWKNLNVDTYGERLSIAAQYVGRECLIYEKDCEPVQATLEGVDVPSSVFIAERTSYCLDDGYDIKLLLRHIHDIRDEHAIHVARMIDEYGYSFEFLKKHARTYKYKVKRVQSQLSEEKWSVLTDKGWKSFPNKRMIDDGRVYIERYYNGEKYHGYFFDIMTMGMTLTLAIMVIGYLRSEGYMIPHEGKSLFDIGLAVRIKN